MGALAFGHPPRECPPHAALTAGQAACTTSSCNCAWASSGQAAYHDKSNGTSTVATFSNRRTGPKASNAR